MEYVTDHDLAVALKNGISKRNVYQRVYDCDWNIQRAITEPVKKRTYRGWQDWKETCKKNGVSNALFNLRVHNGMESEEAANKPVMRRKSN